jgi:CRP/FNR family cyclic AMP-dependent transcriptional regulator
MMRDPNDLKSIAILRELTDLQLEKIAQIALIKEFGAGDYIFREGDEAKHLYAVIDGKVGLEIEKDSSTRVVIDTVNRGETLGFSAMVEMEERKYTTHAKAITRTRLFAWRAADLEKLFHEDCGLGLTFMKGIARIVKTRLQVRNVQFLDIYK